VLAVAVGALLLPLAATGSVAGAQEERPAPAGPGGPSFEGDMAPPVLLPAPPGLRERLAGAAPAGGDPVAAASAPGDGFSLFPGFAPSSFNWGSYRIVLTRSTETPVLSDATLETFRDELVVAARELATIIQAPVTVAPGISAPAPGTTQQTLAPGVGEIRVVVRTQSACGPLSDTPNGTVGCGGPAAFLPAPGSPSGSPALLFGGNVWLARGLVGTTADSIRQAVVSHELGHAFGLNHFNDRYPPPSGPFQLMFANVRADTTAFKSGDINGLGYLQNPFGSFVASTYCDFLDRRVDPGGYRYWVGQLLIDLPGITPLGYVDQLSRSAEYIRTLVTRFYRDTLGRLPDGAGLAFWTGELQAGRRSVADVAGQFYGSAECVGRFSTLSAWVADLYRVRLGRPASLSDQSFWSNRARVVGTATVAREIYQAPESLALRVAALYVEFLRRNPDAGGASFWAPRIAATGDLVLARDLANSAEYFANAPTFSRSCPGTP
jgi:hypothetical protein